jgi:hypothetical protein
LLERVSLVRGRAKDLAASGGPSRRRSPADIADELRRRPHVPKRGDFESYGVVLGASGLAAMDDLFEAARQVQDPSFRAALFEGFATSVADLELALSESGDMTPLGDAEIDLLEAQHSAILRYLEQAAAADLTERERQEYLKSTRERREQLRSLIVDRRSRRSRAPAETTTP